MTINHLKNRDAQRKTLAVAYGRHAVKGHLCWSKDAGTHVEAYNALGEGEWDACEAAYYRGIEILPAGYNFHPGALAEAMDTGPQIVDPLFPLDVPHTRTAAIGYKTPFSLGTGVDYEKNPPLDFEGIFRTKKCPDFDAAGNPVDFAYSANPARCVADALMSYGRLPNLPLIYDQAADYWLTRIDWGAWAEWRDYCAGTETVDYTAFGSGEGFGLRASYYNDLDLDPATFVTSFLQPVIDIDVGAASPAAGVNVDEFSARFEGRIRSKVSGNITFHITHDDGFRLIINGTSVMDHWYETGSDYHFGIYAMEEGELYDIILDWQEADGPGLIKMEWSGKGMPRELVSSKYLYPPVTEQPRYESHIYFNSPTNFADVLRTILFVSNSVMQDVNGKLRFFCLEQLTTPTFDFTGANIDSFTFRRRDILQNEPVTSYEAKFRDLDSQFLEEPPSPIHLDLDYFTRKNTENIKVVDLFNTTRWQALKVLKTRARLETGNDLMCEIGAKMAKSYTVMPGDLVSIAHRKSGETPRNYLVREATDGGSAEASGSPGTETESRTFTLQEWPEE